MENASKALIIAGGVFLALMILSLVVYVLSSMTDFADAQDRAKQVSEIEEFNKSYQAYNKQKMYGIDIISVVNKAINNNKNVASLNTDDTSYINVIINTTKTFETTGTKTNNLLPSDDPNYETSMSIRDFEKCGISIYKSNGLIVGENILGDWNGNTLVMKQGILGLFEQSDTSNIKTIDNYTYYIDSALSNFKKAIFKCEYMEDRKGNDGRIDTIYFTQI